MKKILFITLALALLAFALRNISTNRSEAQILKANRSSADHNSDIWVVVNKVRPLKPLDYAPAELVVPHIPLRTDAQDKEMTVRPDTAAALEELNTAALKDDVRLMLSSGYRSYTQQVALYNYYVEAQGKSVADTQSARPGYSEHQTGLAVDLEPTTKDCEVQACFAKLPEGKWLAANAYKYGFIIRYQQGKQATVGYAYEPWHIRYVGKPLAKTLHENHDETLEEYFKTGPAPQYR